MVVDVVEIRPGVSEIGGVIFSGTAGIDWAETAPTSVVGGFVSFGVSSRTRLCCRESLASVAASSSGSAVLTERACLDDVEVVEVGPVGVTRT